MNPILDDLFTENEKARQPLLDRFEALHVGFESEIETLSNKALEALIEDLEKAQATGRLNLETLGGFNTLWQICEKHLSPKRKDVEKIFYVQNNIGGAKYVVSYHDGIKRHKDGSEFYDIAIFHNKKRLNLFVHNLKNAGYQERG